MKCNNVNRNSLYDTVGVIDNANYTILWHGSNLHRYLSIVPLSLDLKVLGLLEDLNYRGKEKQGKGLSLAWNQ